MALLITHFRLTVVRELSAIQADQYRPNFHGIEHVQLALIA